MRKCVQRGLFGVLCAGGIIVLGTGAASAAQTSGDDGLLSGNQILPQIEAPVSANGNTASVIGDNKVTKVVGRHLPKHAAAKDEPAPKSAKAATASTSGKDSAAGGNQVDAKASAPVSASGNTVSVVGDNEAKNTVKGHSSEARVSDQNASEPVSSNRVSSSTSGADSVAGGNQVDAKVSAPVSANANSVSMVGANNAKNTVKHAEPKAEAVDKKSASATSGADSVAGGNQADAKAKAPISADGNTVAVVGDNRAQNTMVDGSSDGDSPHKSPSGSERGAWASTSGKDSIASGNQADAKASAPVSASGNTVSVVGDNETKSTKNTVTDAKPATEATDQKRTATTSGTDSAVGGNQVLADVLAPVSADGNTVSVVGDNDAANSVVRETGWQGTEKGGHAATTGDDSAVGGNQVLADVLAPVSADGNTVSVIGDNDTRNSLSGRAPTGSDATSEPVGPEAATSGHDSLLAGNQVVPWFFVPVSAEGNTLSAIGDNTTRNSTVDPVADAPAATTTSSPTTSGMDGLAGGNQLFPSLGVPVGVSGNTISVIGDNSVAGTTPDGTAGPGTAPAPGTGTPTTSGDDSVAGGIQVGVSALAPVDISGNSITLVGDNTVAAPAASDTVSGTTPEAGISDPVTSGGDGLLGGNQLLPQVSLPLNLSGNSIALIGDNTVSAPAASGDPVSGTAPEAGTTNPVTSGNDGIAGGNQIAPQVTAPLDLSGNTVSVIGDNTVAAPSADGANGSGTAPEAGSTAPVSSGDDGIVGGNQVVPEVSLPVTVGGNTGSVIGDNAVVTPVEGGTSESGGSHADQGTAHIASGDDALLGGNQVIPGINLPVTIGGNTGSVIGDNTITTPRGNGTTDPGTEPENPGIDPENPGVNPENPGTGPDEPGMPVTPGEPNMPSDPVDPNQPTDSAMPGTPAETDDEVTSGVAGAGQSPVETAATARDWRGAVADGDLAGTSQTRSVARLQAGANEDGDPTMRASGAMNGSDMLAQTGANSGSLVWFGGMLVMLGLAFSGLRRFLGAK